ncbi:hypothetical protein BGZ63DRAFT_421850 [Mariannaea sp. PMI_226]|nr:hypothetical protein BGZ63DRAFT_421850 [Mariannaea sp. PMI_226]
MADSEDESIEQIDLTPSDDISDQTSSHDNSQDADAHSGSPFSGLDDDFPGDPPNNGSDHGNDDDPDEEMTPDLPNEDPHPDPADSDSASDISSRYHPSDNEGGDEGPAWAFDDAEEPNWSNECYFTCRPPWLSLLEKAAYFKARFRAERAAKNDLRREYLRLMRNFRQVSAKAELFENRYKGKARVRTQPTWHNLVETLIDEERGPSWGEIVRISCFENNMPPAVDKTHPDIRLIEPTPRQWRELFRMYRAQAAEIIEIEDDSEDEAEASSSEVENNNRPDGLFQHVPPEILVAILRMVLVFEGESIHALSRLDSYVKPRIVPRDRNGNVSLLHRFHIGSGAFNLTFATKPQDLLGPLLVSKKWNYVAAHLFYSQNKFCFSSLGE